MLIIWFYIENGTARRRWRANGTAERLKEGDTEQVRRGEGEDEERKVERRILRIKRQIESPSTHLVQTDREEESTVAEQEDKLGAFKMLGGKLPAFKTAPPVTKIPEVKAEAEETKKADKEEK